MPSLSPARTAAEHVFELLLPILLLGLGDSLNPTTIGVAVLLATERHPVPRLVAYTVGTALVYFLGGLLLAVGPAALLHTAVSQHPTDRRYLAEIVVGVAGFGVAWWLWTRSAEAVSKRLPDHVKPRHAFAVGAGITLIDLPTALPYFGAIALIVAGDLSFASRVALLVVFNTAYVVPLIGITVIVAVLGERAAAPLQRLREFVTSWSTRMLGIITALSGVYLVAIGVKGLAG